MNERGKQKLSAATDAKLAMPKFSQFQFISGRRQKLNCWNLNWIHWKPTLSRLMIWWKILPQSFGIHHKFLGTDGTISDLNHFPSAAGCFASSSQDLSTSTLFGKMSKHGFATNPSFSLLVKAGCRGCFQRRWNIWYFWIAEILGIKPVEWKAVVIFTQVWFPLWEDSLIELTVESILKSI